jgi:hypothetical protein
VLNDVRKTDGLVLPSISCAFRSNSLLQYQQCIRKQLLFQIVFGCGENLRKLRGIMRVHCIPVAIKQEDMSTTHSEVYEVAIKVFEPRVPSLSTFSNLIRFLWGTTYGFLPIFIAKHL